MNDWGPLQAVLLQNLDLPDARPLFAISRDRVLVAPEILPERVIPRCRGARPWKEMRRHSQQYECNISAVPVNRMLNIRKKHERLRKASPSI